MRYGPLLKIKEFLLSAGDYEDESRDQRARRRIVIGIVWVSVPGLAAAGLTGVGTGAIALEGLKAATHFAALLALWAAPRRIVAIFLMMSSIDLAADFTLSLLYGGLYESGLQILWSLVAALGLLVIASVPVTAVFLGVTIAATLVIAGLSPRIEPTYTLANPENDATGAIILIALFIFLGLFYFVRQSDRFQQESDNLLHNILPDKVAERLKTDDSTIAESFEAVSVVFADVVDFTPLSARLRPEQLVGLLSDVFAAFDAFVDEQGMEKIKTVGDEYMAAAGVPEATSDHAHAAARLAIRMRDHVATHTFAGHTLSLRIGINSGPVTAGIIGTKKFAYDLWGDTVNVASRMESEGAPNKIQITEATYGLLEDGFVCEPRGVIAVKGRGNMPAYFLLDATQANAQVPNQGDRFTTP